MSKYTTELRFICESLAGETESVGMSGVEDVIASARTHIFDFNYPIFDSAYKAILETKILRHYYTREIGYETYGLWKLKLATKLNEIMPYYNKLYESELLEFNPLNNVIVQTTHEKMLVGANVTNSNVDTTENKTESRDKHSLSNNRAENETTDAYSDTPQGALTDVMSGEYLTTANDTKTTGESNSTNVTSDTAEKNGAGNRSEQTEHSMNTTEQYIESISGNNGNKSFAKLLEEYRKTILNIDEQIIGELNSLFMLIW